MLLSDCESMTDQELADATPQAKHKQCSRWQPEWVRYNVSASRRGSSFVFCKVCTTDFSLARGGVHEVK